MDGGFVAAEDSRRRVEPLALALAPKCAGSPVPINRIAIDLNCPMEEIPSPKHEHFSMLGYVSEMRKKDRKVCLPFASEGGDGLTPPPLPVPKFRWWQCADCVDDNLDQKSDAGTSSFHNGVGENHSRLLIQNIGDDHGSEDSMDYNYESDKLMDNNPEGSKSTPYVWNNEGGSSFPRKKTEVNKVQMKEINLNNSAAKNPSSVSQESERESSSSDEDVSLSSLPPKRKRKLRSLADIIKKVTNLIPTQNIEDDLDPDDYLEASSDATKGATKTHRRKRKMVLEEEEEEEEKEMVPPIAIDKKLKGLVTETENNSCDKNNNTFNIVEISESESEKDDSRPKLFGSRLGAKTRKNKARKPRSIDINRKARRTDTENRTSGPMVNLQKYPPVAAGTANVGGMGSFFKKSLFGQRMDSIPDVSIDKRVEEGRYNPYMPPSNQNGLGDRNNKIQEKVTLDLSLSSYAGGERNLEKQESSGRHTGIPDLNESFVEKVSMTEGLQLPTFPAKALHKNTDMFAPSNKQTDNNNIGVVERGGTSDDIPMEIVELLAKNQHERALDDAKKHPRSNGFYNNSNPFKGSSPCIEGTRYMPNFPYPNAISGLSMSSAPTKFLNFPRPKNCQPNMGQVRQHSPLMPGQHMIGSGPNNVSGQRPSNGADLLWPPRRKNVTFDLGLPSGSKNQTYKDKDVKRAVSDGSLVREGGIRSGSKPVGSTMDAYSSDTIPAMQLLSLMDQRIVPGSSLKVGAPNNNNFPNRLFSPCNEHPRPINTNHNQNGPFNSSSSFFGQSSRTADFPAILNGIRYSVDSSKKTFAQGRMPPLKANSKPTDLAGPSNVSAQPSRGNLNLEVCTLNRNPADFSIPDARNVFMISAKDLKPKKRNAAAKEKFVPRNLEEPKKQRARKDSSRRK